MSKILVVEDEQQLSHVIVEWLTEEFYVVEASYDALDASEKLRLSRYDLIILDLMLPGMSGFELCKNYRAGGGDAPIIILTAKKSLSAKELGLDSGADDYMTKPFKLRELSARIRALLRRPRAVLHTVLTVGSVSIDTAARKVTKGGEEVRLLAKEYTLLELLMRNAGKVMSVENILDGNWTQEKDVSPDTVRSYIRSLRKKLDSDENTSIIQNVHGIGYKLELR